MTTRRGDEVGLMSGSGQKLAMSRRRCLLAGYDLNNEDFVAQEGVQTDGRIGELVDCTCVDRCCVLWGTVEGRRSEEGEVRR